MGSYQSGQLGLTVTQLSFDFGGSNPSLPTIQLASISIKRLINQALVNWKLSDGQIENCGSSSVDRALAFQAEGRGFESRLPLHYGK